MEESQEQEQPKNLKTINCDQVSWIMAILTRYSEAVRKNSTCPSISRLGKTAKLAALLELMEILGLKFDDDLASGNGLSELTEFNELRKIGDASNKARSNLKTLV